MNGFWNHGMRYERQNGTTGDRLRKYSRQGVRAAATTKSVLRSRRSAVSRLSDEH